MHDEKIEIPNVKKSNTTTPKNNKQNTMVKNEPRVIVIDTSEIYPEIITGKDQPQLLRKIKVNPSYPISTSTILQTDSKKKSFKCNLCLRLFTRKSSFSRHMLTHMKGTALKCYMCRKKFYCRILLDDHIRRHGEKPFECKICQTRFVRDRNLKRHLRTVKCRLPD